jgi:mono/diheme cytochrome c family protein
VREQLDKHRADTNCAACHAKINPHFPASGPTQWLFQGPPAQSKILAVNILLFVA